MADLKRKYRKRRRAEQEDETRLRITAALVALHGSVGPAHTTVKAVAERAGVQRATVYRHFPDEQSMFDACSAHWLEQNPFPDPAVWATMEDPHGRLRSALTDVYGFYARNEAMLDNTTRDEPYTPALRPSMDAFRAYLRGAADMLANAGEGSRRCLERAAIGHALDFSTWRSLVRDQGLTERDAVALMAAMVELAPSRP